MTTSTTTPFLSFPNQDDEPGPSTERAQAAPTKTVLLKDRLYVGNLHPSVDEYTLLTLFSKFGSISSLDFLFHKSGPSRGKPRGYAFVEFADQAVSAPPQFPFSPFHPSQNADPGFSHISHRKKINRITYHPTDPSMRSE
jgi:RNA recognition motif. (a.k.a. RRM, RBD, or RNP domain)